MDPASRLRVAAEALATMLFLFDLDGTLTDSRIGIVRSFAHTLERMGRASMDLPLLVCIGPPLPVAFQTLLATDDPALIEEAVAIYRERFERIGMFENALFPGIAEGLEMLHGQGHVPPHENWTAL